MQRIPRRRFPEEFKSQAIALAEPLGPANAARQLDISVKTLPNWLGNARFMASVLVGQVQVQAALRRTARNLRPAQQHAHI